MYKVGNFIIGAEEGAYFDISEIQLFQAPIEPFGGKCGDRAIIINEDDSGI